MKKRPLNGVLLAAPHLAPMLLIEEQGAEVTFVAGQVPIVGVSGPMLREDHGRILAAVDLALKSDASTFVLAVDSPGGEADFCFDSVRNARARVEASGKRCIAWVGASCLSAGFAWACVASEIHAAPEALVGSIGVIQMLNDATGANEQRGIRMIPVTSGTRKADGNPFAGISDDAIEATKSIVDGLAQSFFELVAEARDMTVAQVAKLQGATMVAKFAGSLVDSTVERSDMLAGIIKGNDNMTFAEMAAKLKAAADEGDEEAKTELAALVKAVGVGDDDDGEPEKSEEERAKAKAFADEEEKAKAKAVADEEEKAKAKSDAEALGEEVPLPPKKKEEAKAMALAMQALKAQGDANKAELAAIRKSESDAKESAERDALLAARPDLAEGTRKLLASAPLAQVKFTLDAMGPGPTPTVGAGARGGKDAGVTGLRAVGTVQQTEDLDRQMGFVKVQPTVVRRAGSIKFGVLAPIKIGGKK